MAAKTDIVSLKWVVGLMNKQAENAEAALVEYSKDPNQKKPLLQCMWAVHQITSTLRALGIKKGEMLSIEMERALNFIYKDRVQGERRKLAMGGLMQALKVLPAYLSHVQNVREDTGRGLEQYVNDLRRWVGERPRPQAFFFHMEVAELTGISVDQSPASDDEIKSRANVMLALYLEMAKSALRKRNVQDSMKTVARIARKMQTLFAGSEPERFWMVQIGLCEGIAGGLIQPDECIAQVFKAGAFMIKYARENGAQLDPSAEYQDHLQYMLYYMAACKARPVHIAKIREVFAIDEDTIAASNRGLVHIDALVTALNGALDKLNAAADYITSHDLSDSAGSGMDTEKQAALENIENAQYRLDAASQIAHAESLQSVYGKLKKLYEGGYGDNAGLLDQVVTEIVRSIVDVKLDVEYKLEHGVCSSFSSREFELRESVITATFAQMALVENHLQAVLRRKALASALVKKPSDARGVLALTLALNRYLNKSDQGHEQLREVVRRADAGEDNTDQLYALAKDYLDQLDVEPERIAIRKSQQLLAEISGALGFAGMEQESSILDRCLNWLTAAAKAGSVREDEAFRCFADVFAQIDMHLQRSVIDPLDDTSHMLAFAERRVGELEGFIGQLSSGADIVAGQEPFAQNYVKDGEIPVEFREVFIEESEEITGDLQRLQTLWAEDPQVNDLLKDMRRHFHTFKGNGRAVGANVLGELGWAAQDMLDRVLDGELTPDSDLQLLVAEVISALPALVASYKQLDGFDEAGVRELTNKCFRMAQSGEADLAQDMPQFEQGNNGPALVSTVQPVA